MTFKVVRFICGGMDVHKNLIVATIGTTDRQTLITEYIQQSFSTFYSDLIRLKEWFISHDCYDVCMESTGKYWIPIYNVLETELNICLTHPKYVKAIKGKKTDKRDSKWICDLYKCDLVKHSFIPKKEIREMREIARYRCKLVYMRSSERNRYHNCLTVSFYSRYLDGMAFQIGYQPLMRCRHQSGYIMPIMNAIPLQNDNRFEKLRFLQSEELSNRVYEIMNKGKKIFPHEGIGKSLDILRTIQKAVIFSEDDLLYAYDHGVVDKKMFPTIDNLKEVITTFQVDGICVSIQKGEIEYPITPSVLREINDEYDGRNLLDDIGNMIHQYPEQRRYREQRCIDIYGKLI